MPIDITARRDKTKTITVEYDGESAEVAYKPGEITPYASREVQEHVDSSGDNYLVSLLCKWVKEWDLTFDGERIPLEPGIVGTIETPLLTAVLNAITEDMTPGKTTNSGSFAG